MRRICVSWTLRIFQCLGGRGLATICQLMCEDYGSRTSGVPDLIIWNAETNQGKFVEVKGPGDNLQENQKACYTLILSLQMVNIELTATVGLDRCAGPCWRACGCLLCLQEDGGQETEVKRKGEASCNSQDQTKMEASITTTRCNFGRRDSSDQS